MLDVCRSVSLTGICNSGHQGSDFLHFIVARAAAWIFFLEIELSGSIIDGSLMRVFVGHDDFFSRSKLCFKVSAATTKFRSFVAP